ncbi:MAG TPA: hypothetical protein VFW98_00170, partial [Gemmatimonadaceae bacterium]|nr:hypothetical protein [Gemmatimonadaceae bacterium]
MRYGRLFAGAAVALTAAALACLNDGPVAPGHESVRLQLHAQIVGQLVDPPPGAETVEIAVFYHRVAGDSLQLPSSPPSVTVAPGTTSQQALAVQLGACLADPLRVGAGEAGCRLSVSLRLLDAAGTTLDQQTTAPPAPVIPGQSVTIPTVTLHALPPVFLLSDSTAVFGAVLNGADPASDTISVTMDRGTARTVQATVSYAQSGQTWLSTALSADTTPARLALTSHIAGLAAGSYSATVTVQSDSTTLAPAPRTIAVTLTIFRVPVASVTMLPTADTITVGAADTIHAVPRDSASAVLAGRTVQWTSSDTTVATVSAASSVSNGDGASMGVT